LAADVHKRSGKHIEVTFFNVSENETRQQEIFLPDSFAEEYYTGTLLKSWVTLLFLGEGGSSDRGAGSKRLRVQGEAVRGIWCREGVTRQQEILLPGSFAEEYYTVHCNAIEG
jgi:hypothetical protein